MFRRIRNERIPTSRSVKHDSISNSVLVEVNVVDERTKEKARAKTKTTPYVE
jgi:hypothetical protein